MRLFKEWVASVAIAAVTAMTATASVSMAATANDFPQRPIRYVVPFSAGGLTDTMARIISQKLSETWKQPILVENRAGGNANIGAEVVAKSPNDGYTWLAITLAHAGNQTLFPKSGYILDRDFTAVAGLATSPLVLVVHADSPIRNMKDLVALARSSKLNAGTSGNGTPPHLGLALLEDAIAVDIQPVPYKGGVQAVTDLLGKQIDLIVANLPEVIAHINSGKLRPLAVASKQRHPLLPDVPTMAEAGYPSVVVENWTGLVVPVGTPKVIIDKIAVDVLKLLQQPEVRDKIAAAGFRPTGLGPEEFQAYVKSEIRRWAVIIRTAKITPE